MHCKAKKDHFILAVYLFSPFMAKRVFCNKPLNCNAIDALMSHCDWYESILLIIVAKESWQFVWRGILLTSQFLFTLVISLQCTQSASGKFRTEMQPLAQEWIQHDCQGSGNLLLERMMLLIEGKNLDQFFRVLLQNCSLHGSGKHRRFPPGDCQALCSTCKIITTQLLCSGFAEAKVIACECTEVLLFDFLCPSKLYEEKWDQWNSLSSYNINVEYLDLEVCLVFCFFPRASGFHHC